MKIKIDQAKQLSLDVLAKVGFSMEDSELITKNLIDAELSGRKSHGFVRLPAIKRNVESGKLSSLHDDIEIVKDNLTNLLINAKHKPAFIPIYKSLEIATKKAKESGICIVGIQDAEYCSGFIGSYARQAALSDLIFIGFNNSPGGLVPFGAKKELWGTDPVTIGVPTDDIPVVLDMASSQITWGDLMVAKQEGKTIKEGVAIDKDGNPTTNPVEAMDGGLLPIAGHKGSGLAFMVELIAGALTGSRVGFSVEGGWGTAYILINPEIFRPLADFKRDVRKAIDELKQAPKARGVEEIYFPGEKSQKMRAKQLMSEEIEVSDKLYSEIELLAKGGKL
ncbi:Ldh family oxidoreductase [Patescibacteria group bacterium]|nr:Ldh family oxidoreductase [Patescibacteria group bacterium]